MSIDRSEDEAPTEVDVDLSSSASAEITIKPQMVVPVLGTHAPRAPSPSLLEEEDSTATDLRPVVHVAPVRPAMDSVDSVTDQTIDVPVEFEDPKEETTRLLLAPPSPAAILAFAPDAVEGTPALLPPAAVEAARRPRVPEPRKSRLRLFVLLAAMISLSTAASILIVLERKPPVSASPSPSPSSPRGTAARSPSPRSPVKPAPPAAPSAKPAAPLHL